jgi:hypothetical protein
MILYSAACCTQDWSKRLKRYFYDIRIHSNTASNSLGSIPPYAAIQARRQIVNQSTTVYCQVLIDTAESTGAMQIGKKLSQGFNIAAHISNPDNLSRETEALRLNHCARQQCVYLHYYQHLLWLLIIIVQLFFNFSDVLRERTSLKQI